MAKRNYYELTLDISGLFTSSEIAEKIILSIKENYPKDYYQHFYHITLTGAFPYSLPLSVKDMMGYLGELYHVKIEDQTYMVFDIEALKQEESLQGYFVNELFSSSMDEALIHQALQVGLKAFFSEVDYYED